MGKFLICMLAHLSRQMVRKWNSGPKIYIYLSHDLIYRFYGEVFLNRPSELKKSFCSQGPKIPVIFL